MNEILRFRVELTPGEALALMQLIERSTTATYRGCAIDEEEVVLMKAALDKVGRGARKGRYRATKPK